MFISKKLKTGVALSVLAFSFTAQALEVSQLIMDVDKIYFKNDVGNVVTRDVYVGIGDKSQISSKQKNGRAQPAAIDISRSRSGQIQLDAGFANIVWKDVPKWLTVDIEVVGRDMMLNIGRLKNQKITASQVDITKPRLGMIRLRGLDINCISANGDRMTFEGLLPMCLEKAQIKSQETDIPELTKYAQLALSESEVADGERNLGKELNLNIDKGQMDLTLNLALKMNLNIRLKVKGKVTYNEKSNSVKIDLENAMLNRLNVTALAFPVIKLILQHDDIQIQGKSLVMKL